MGPRNRAERRRQRSRNRRRLVAAGLTAAVLVPAAQLAFPAVASAGTNAQPNLWDPDTFQAPSGAEFTYFSSQPGGRGACGQAAWGARFAVPVIQHDVNGLGNLCITADALPGGPGAGFAWSFDGNDDVWAPGIAYFSGRYFLYYTARKAGTGQRCIGVASSSSPTGPFTGQREWACPPGGRWAIDPDVLVDSTGVFVTYRDDAITTGNQTGISTVQVDANGSAIWSTRKSVLVSSDVGWAFSTRTNTNVVENPSLVKWSDGTYYLFFSGNDFASNAYATGIASCGNTALPASRCKPLVDVNRPYFGNSATNPVRTLPGSPSGPGAMSIYNANYKGAVVRSSWAALGGGERRSTSGYSLTQSGGYFNIS